MAEEFNILKHELVPEHIILNEKEKNELLEKYRIKPKNLPKILTTDPVVKALNAKEGDILKIIRKSKTAGTSMYYRIVVKKKK
ncbi:MAG: DNA-directed RNA polymerase subunit H [Candidatus Aenigmarchaeota archaeon]|nr:DNA-directed RNA polymerase subunit H [Candidatus Aenigmarchaeota archaeon]